MGLLDFQEKQLVEIVANDEWKGLIGIVHKKVEGTLQIFSVNKPCDLYIVHEGNKDAIRPYSDSRQ